MKKKISTDKNGNYLCPKCNRILIIGCFSWTSDYPERFRIICRKCKKYGAWRKSSKYAGKAFIADKISFEHDEPED